MDYWWEGDTAERYWVEIRKVPGIGTELWSPTHDTDGGTDPWYNLVGSVRAGQVVYHWNAREHRFVGRSYAASEATVRNGKFYQVPLRDFEPIAAVSLDALREHSDDLYQLRDDLRQIYGDPLYLPFQFTSDRSQFRCMSNYFAKLPAQAVGLLFGKDGLGTSRVVVPPTEDPALVMPPAGGSASKPTHHRRAFLQPFRPKADAGYISNITGGRKTRDQHHETLVNSCANWLAAKGLTPGCNAAIDLGVTERRTIIEAKVVRRSWAAAIREAVGQLYEYRFFKVADPSSHLIFLVDRPAPDDWVSYLERDRRIGVMWPVGSEFFMSPLAAKALKL
ncbi:hypothetical protein ABGB07_08520 [Micromonosporaceae bacterium B7E4]